jgi:hypothetical protein
MTASRTAIAIPIMIGISRRSLWFMGRIQTLGEGRDTRGLSGKVGVRLRPGCPVATPDGSAA